MYNVNWHVFLWQGALCKLVMRAFEQGKLSRKTWSCVWRLKLVQPYTRANKTCQGKVGCVFISEFLCFFSFRTQGYLKTSIVVLGPGDQAPVSDNYISKNVLKIQNFLDFENILKNNLRAFSRIAWEHFEKPRLWLFLESIFIEQLRDFCFSQWKKLFLQITVLKMLKSRCF